MVSPKRILNKEFKDLVLLPSLGHKIRKVEGGAGELISSNLSPFLSEYLQGQGAYHLQGCILHCESALSVSHILLIHF